MATKLQDLISVRWLSRCWRPPASDHGPSLAPFFAIQLAYGERRGIGPWAWADPRAVDEATAAAWHLTGRWLARRGATVSRVEFEERLRAVVPALAQALNRGRVGSLRDLRGLRAVEPVVRRVGEAVLSLSSLRNTREVQPVFGSKVLHHFFPSVVPAFDGKYVRDGVLRMEELRPFERDDDGGWLPPIPRKSATEAAMRDFHRYFAACARAISRAPEPSLREVRRRFGTAFLPYAPGAFAEDPASLLWRLDAKIAEYCFLGRAAQQGCLGR